MHARKIMQFGTLYSVLVVLGLGFICFYWGYAHGA